jgi:hypothetical protein
LFIFSQHHSYHALCVLDVVGEMVEVFPAEEFLMSLPADGSLWFLLPFISRCLQRKHLDQLKEIITQKGKSLFTHLNPPS